MIRAVAAILICLALAGLWWHGFKRGEAADKLRSDGEIARMQLKASERLIQANAEIYRQSDALQTTKERAERDLQSEKARNERRLADQRATDALVRQQLADFASGDGSDQDSAAAANQRAATIGQLLGESLQLQTELAGAAESESDNVRALLKAWPKLTENP